MVTFLRGPREFLMDVRKKPELAALAMDVATKFLENKITRMTTAVGPNFSRDNPNGNILWWCDGGGGYLNLEEFKKFLPNHWGVLFHSPQRKELRHSSSQSHQLNPTVL
jgi:hypothetical protein